MNGTEDIQADSVEAVQAAVMEAAAAGSPLEIVAGGTKRGYGRPVQAQRVLNVSGLRGVVDYQPHELILVARPGTPLAEIEATVAEAGQMLPFEPPHWHPDATLGGAIACNLSGPRRMRAGAARDHLLGFKGVTGTGEIINGGGRVVKNVTGYDLSKLICGSFGTLVVLTEVVLKVLPRAERERTLLFPGLDAQAGVARMIAAVGMPLEVSAAAYLPAGLPLPEPAELHTGKALTAVRLEGPQVSLEERGMQLRGDTPPAAGDVLDGEDSRAFWEALRELRPLAPEATAPGGTEAAEGQGTLWRLAVPPMAGAKVAAGLGAVGLGAHFIDWGGALVWATGRHDVQAEPIHALAQAHGGIAQCVRGAMDLPFTPLDAGQERINRNLKGAFDPHGIFNPGRLYPGW